MRPISLTVALDLDGLKASLSFEFRPDTMGPSSEAAASCAEALSKAFDAAIGAAAGRAAMQLHQAHQEFSGTLLRQTSMELLGVGAANASQEGR